MIFLWLDIPNHKKEIDHGKTINEISYFMKRKRIAYEEIQVLHES